MRKLTNSRSEIIEVSSHACIFDNTGGQANIIDNAFRTWASTNNNKGLIAGKSENGCFLFDATGGGNNVPLPDDIAYVSSINESGQIVGSGYGNTGGILYNIESGTLITLGNVAGLPDYLSFNGNSINDFGQIVGDGVNLDTGKFRPCLFDPTGQGNNIDLNKLIDPASGWTLERAFCINNNGWIVGQGINPAGQEHAYLLTPEPASVLLFTLGGATILRKRRS